MMKMILNFTVLTLLLTAAPRLADAQSSSKAGRPSFDFRKKAESKETSRWTLAEWLDQKDRNYMMDLWLGMYAPSPYEFYISGNYNSNAKEEALGNSPFAAGSENYRSYSGSIGAYALIMGIVGEYENNTGAGYVDTSGSLNIRILGNAIQGTHLVLQGGLRTREIALSNTRLNQTFTGAELEIYVMRYFGLHGLYRNFLPYNEGTLGETKGTRSEAGAFIDFGPVRIYVNQYWDVQESMLNNTPNKNERTGTQSGLKFFF